MSNFVLKFLNSKALVTICIAGLSDPTKDLNIPEENKSATPRSLQYKIFHHEQVLNNSKRHYSVPMIKYEMQPNLLRVVTFSWPKLDSTPTRSWTRTPSTPFAPTSIQWIENDRDSSDSSVSYFLTISINTPLQKVHIWSILGIRIFRQLHFTFGINSSTYN